MTVKKDWIERVRQLSTLDLEKYVRLGKIGKVEENVKIKVIIPLLECLGFEDKDMNL